MKKDVLNIVYLILVLSAIFYYTDGANSRPVCSTSYYSANVMEGTKKPASVINVSCSDPDNDVLTYSFDINGGGNFDNTFTLNSSTGELKLNKAADAEQIDFATKLYSYPFTMRVRVNDSVNPPLVITMFVAITDKNDFTPIILGLPKTISIPENTAVGTLLATGTLWDLDYTGGGNGVAFARIISGDPNGTFSMDYRRCILMLVRSLDFETTPKYVLVLQAYDIGLNNNNSKSSNVTLTVSVTDVNDNQPTCTAYNLIHDVDEMVSLGSVLAQLNCSDKESKSSLNYAITSRVPTTDTRLQVSSTTGAVTLTGALDYEKNDRKLEIKIQVSDTGIMSTIVTVVFRVTDADDNPPVLDTLYVGYISEDANIGAYVLTTNATDVDSPNTPLSKVTFGFENGCSQPNWFKIDSYTGSIFVNSLLDWETAPNVTCKVFAYSSNQYAKRRISDVVIKIKDVNDREPDFTKYLFEGHVLENSPLGISVANVSAVDRDSGNNGMFNFSMPHSKQFIIDPITGEITLNDSMDYEAEISYLVLVEARDFGIPTFSSQTYVNIKVLPVNEFSPVFAHQVGTQTVSEGAEIGSVLATILATDGDHGLDGQIVYRLLDDTVPFILEPDKGDLVVRLGLDAEAQTQYNVTVIASDLSETNPKSTSMSFLVNVLDVNDNPPRCEFPEHVLLKSPPALIPLVKLNCSDVDTSSPILRYEISGGNSNNVFRVDPATGEISLPVVDNAAVGDYQLLVKVTDNGVDSKYTTFALEVKLEIDLHFIDFPDFPVHVIENADVLESVLNVTATGAYDVVKYEILSGNVNGQYIINKYSGHLVLAKSLDRETLDHYTLDIRASTPSGQVLVKSLDITVDDFNDNAPTFPNSRYERRVLESVALPKSLGIITAVDRDRGNNSLLTYYFCSADYDNIFGIDAATGEITIKGALDSESTPAYNLLLCVKDGGSPTLSSSTAVFVSIENEDEYKPSITPPEGSINLTLSEDTAIGSKVLVINGSDPDRGSELSYEIFNGGPFSNFAIDEHTGEVYLVYPLDKEALPSFTFSVSVADANGQSAVATVLVNVTDVNDNDPVFEPHTYVFVASHGTAPNTKIGELIVKDIDAGFNGTLALSITSGDPSGFFAVSSLSLMSKKQLDANSQNIYYLTVTATDSGSPPRSSSAFVTVNIDPEFKRPSFDPILPNHISLLEDKAVGSLVIGVSATQLGATEGADGDLLYTIINGDPYANFRIVLFGGEIQLVSPLEYARKPFFSLLVLAQNRYQPSLNSTVLVNITVLQVNLCSPQFSSDVYNWTVNEAAVVGSSVGQVIATDNDVGQFGKVTFLIKSGVPFQVNSSTGSVTLNSQLEFSQTKSYSFYVTATDDAGASSKTSSAVVFVYVIDSNNHAPAFASSTYSLTLPESFPLQLGFHIALAHDSDSGLFGALEYSITGGNTGNVFGIDQTTGAISLLKNVDFESDKTFHLTVQAKDGGNPRLNGYTSVIVNVSDVNDNAPVFPSGTVELSVQQTLPALSLLYSASASDKDSGTNGAFSYIIAGGNDEGLFTIDTLNGQLRTAKTLMSSSGFYTLTVAAVDRGWPSLTGTIVVSVAITPVTGLPVDMSVGENEPSGTHVGYIPHSSSVTGFSLSGGNYLQAFTINNATGEVKTTKPLDREDYGFYQLSVTLWDHVNVDSTTTLKIKVLDKNDNAPEFSAPTQTLKIVENMPTGSSLGQVTAHDIDEPGPNSDVTYTLLSSPGNQFFLVDGANGALSLKQSIDYETVSSVVLEVLAKDNGSPQMSSTVTVFVVVYDVPETVTKHGFNTSYFISHEFPYDAVKSDVVCSLVPEDFDLDTILNSIIDVTSVGDNVFSISSSGEVKVNMPSKMFERGRYIQWMVLTASGKAESLVGLLRLDTFNKDKHLVAVVTSLDEADLRAKIDILRQDLQAKFPAPKKVKIWQVQATTSISNRRKLLAAESAALTVVLADGAADAQNNVEMDKTFLTQSEILSILQQSSDGTPVSGLSSNVPVTKVVPYQDTSQDSSSLDTTVIVLIVFGILAAIIAIGIAIIVTYYCFKRRKIEEDKLGLVQRDTTTQSSESMNQEKNTYTSFPEDTEIDDHLDDYDDSSSMLLTPSAHSQVTDVQPSDRTVEVNNVKGANPIQAQYISSSFPHQVDPSSESLRTLEVNNMEQPRPLKATYISSTYTATGGPPHTSGPGAGVKNIDPVVNTKTSHNPIVATFISSSYEPTVDSNDGLPEVEEMSIKET